MDFSLARGLNDWTARHRVIEAIAEFLAQDGVVFVVLCAVVLFLARGRWSSAEGRRAAVAAAGSTVVALLAGQLLSGLVDRARPFVSHPHVHLLIAHARDAGFPSDHATGSFAIAVALLLRHRRAGLFALAVATLVAVARVAVGVHYPTDVLAGAALGAASAIALHMGPLRRLIDAVADRIGAIYDRVIAGALNLATT